MKLKLSRTRRRKKALVYIKQASRVFILNRRTYIELLGAGIIVVPRNSFIDFSHVLSGYTLQHVPRQNPEFKFLPFYSS